MGVLKTSGIATPACNSFPVSLLYTETTGLLVIFVISQFNNE
jgi:hypothetical protein